MHVLHALWGSDQFRKGDEKPVMAQPLRASVFLARWAAFPKINLEKLGYTNTGHGFFHYDRAVSDDGLAGLASCSVSLTMVALGLVRGDDLN